MGLQMSFKTKRLIIRSPEERDGVDIFKNYSANEAVTKYLCWKPHKTVDESVDWIKLCIKKNNGITNLVFCIVLKETDECIGMIDFKIDGFKCNFGYVLAQDYWNKGIMTEAMKPVIEHVMGRPDIVRIFATHDIENTGSGKVMEKLGMAYEGTLRKYVIHPNASPFPRDAKIYSIVKP